MVASLEGTRIRIVELLQQKGSANVEELAKYVELAPPTVRRHLDILLRDQVVSYKQVRKSVGRPYYTYFLTEAGKESLPKEYDKLLTMMLNKLSSLSSEDLKTQTPQELIDKLFVDMAHDMAGSYKLVMASGQSVEKKLAQLMEVLTRYSFNPEAETKNNTIRIHLNNCPFRAAAMASPAVCLFDQTFISEMLDVPVKKEQCIIDGDTGCCYVVTPAGQAPQASTPKSKRASIH